MNHNSQDHIHIGINCKIIPKSQSKFWILAALKLDVKSGSLVDRMDW